MSTNKHEEKSQGLGEDTGGSDTLKTSTSLVMSKLDKGKRRQAVNGKAEAGVPKREKAVVHLGEKDDNPCQNAEVTTHRGGGTDAGPFANHIGEVRGQMGRDGDQDAERP